MLPRGLLISAPSSGAGKTTVTLGLIRALHDKRLKVQPFKSGPDYIDPAFHHAAAHRPSYNIDTWSMSNKLIMAIIAQAQGADIIIGEGSMGLFDGVITKGASGYGTSAETAKLMGWPIVMVIDVSGQAQSAAATALGFLKFDRQLPLAGVILNRVASARHEKLVRYGMKKAGIRVFGALPRRGDLVLPERHLGLIQALEHPNLEKAITDYACFLNEHVDLDALKATATSSAASKIANLPKPPAQRIAIAQDKAFSFIYPHLLKGWKEAGAEIQIFSPLANEKVPETAELVWLPGGYPELHAGRISAADIFMKSLKLHSKSKMIHGECGGYMVLGETLEDKDGKTHKMAGLLGLSTSYKKRKFHLGYRRAKLKRSIMGFKKGCTLRGHEFHYCTITEQKDKSLAEVFDADGSAVLEKGSYRGNVSGTFFHLITEAPL